MAIVRATEAPTFTLPGLKFTGLTSPKRGATELCTWQLQIEPNTPTGAPHYLNHEEVFVVLEGAITVSVNDTTETLAVGDAIAVPANAMLSVGNLNSEPARAIVCVPAGIHARFADGQDFGTPPWAQ